MNLEQLKKQISQEIVQSMQEWDHQRKLYGSKPGPVTSIARGACLALAHIRGQINKILEDYEHNP